jgi:hypothetical protein
MKNMRNKHLSFGRRNGECLLRLTNTRQHFLGHLLERGSTHNLVEEHLRTLDRQVSEKWDAKDPEKTLGETAGAF